MGGCEEGGVDGGDLGEEGVGGFPICGGVGGDGGFVGVVEEGEEAVVFGVEDGVVFVGVALGALGGEAEDGFADGIDAVEDAFGAELFGFCAAFFVGRL